VSLPVTAPGYSQAQPSVLPFWEASSIPCHAGEGGAKEEHKRAAFTTKTSELSWSTHSGSGQPTPDSSQRTLTPSQPT